jgi:hypothetical protein
MLDRPQSAARKVGKARTHDLAVSCPPTFHVDLLKACYAEAAKMEAALQRLCRSVDDNVCG